MAEAKTKGLIRKPKTKVIKNKIEKPKPIINDNYVVLDYSSFSNPDFIDFIEQIWTEKVHVSNNENFHLKYRFSSVIAEIRYHINEKQIQTQKIAQKYGSYDQNSDNWIIPPEVQQQFQNELNTLNNERIQSENLKLSIQDLKKVNIWSNNPFNSMSCSLIEQAADFIDYGDIEDNNE
tara:strand:+ start:2833 stop:3366 length:534 start_codon:yes stop_codon:yes gene_type:complete